MLYCNLYFLSGYLMIVTGYPTTVYLRHMDLSFKGFLLTKSCHTTRLCLRLAVEFISELSSAFP